MSSRCQYSDKQGFTPGKQLGRNQYSNQRIPKEETIPPPELAGEGTIYK